MRIRSFWPMAFLAVATAVAAPAASQQPDEGVKIKNPGIVGRMVRSLASAEKMEQIGEQQYVQLTRQAQQKRALLPGDHPQVVRLRRIFNDLLPHAYKFNERARNWRWDVNVVNSQSINAFCMPGGKIAFFTGILQKLQLTDDEVAMVMGHEIAHALREHSRARAAKSTLTNIGTMAVAVLVGGNAGEIARMGGGLLEPQVLALRRDGSRSDRHGARRARRLQPGVRHPRCGRR